MAVGAPSSTNLAFWRFKVTPEGAYSLITAFETWFRPLDTDTSRAGCEPSSTIERSQHQLALPNPENNRDALKSGCRRCMSSA